VATALVLNRTAYGRNLSAVGQNLRAARLAGVRTGWVIGIAFVASSTIAALTGVLLGAYIGGAFLEMGQPYLLQSIGAVVLGGTLIFGGSATALGTLFGSVLLVLIVTTMQIAGLPPGTQDVIQGLVIIVVLALAGGLSLRRNGKAAQTSTDVGASPTTGRGGQPPEEGQPLEDLPPERV
jgi:ribose transport system permease protein